MNIPFTLLFLLRSAVAGAPCTEKVEERNSPCTASDAEQRDIMKYIRDGMNAYTKYEAAKNGEENLRKAILTQEQQGLQPPLEQRTAWETANGERLEFEKAMQANLDKAAMLTSQYYGLGHEAGGIVNGPMNDYTTVKWKPQFLYAPKDSDGRYQPQYLKIDRSDENKPAHYLKVDFGKDADRVQGQTFENGSVYLNIEAFNLALQKGSPRLLAKTLYHEGVHYEELKTIGWKKFKEEMEPSAYQKSLDAAGIFELTANERDAVKDQRDIAQQALDDVNDGKRKGTTSFPTPDQQRDWKRQFNDTTEEHRISQERLTLEQGLAAARAAVERAKEEQRKKEEERREQEAFERTMEEYNNEVRAYGFAPLRPSRSGQSPGFANPYRAEYRFTAATNLVEAKMALFFSWACAHEGVRDDKESRDAFANLLIDINNNWREPIFRSRLELETTDGSQEDCLRYVRDNLQPPMSLQKVDIVVSRFWKDWNKGALHRFDDYERQRRLGEEARDRQNRGQSGRDRRDDGSGNGCTGPNKYGIIGCPAPNPQ